MLYPSADDSFNLIDKTTVSSQLATAYRLANQFPLAIRNIAVDKFPVTTTTFQLNVGQ